jgi:hypothetical protein
VLARETDDAELLKLGETCNGNPEPSPKDIDHSGKVERLDGQRLNPGASGTAKG